jgi:hypothetical protein
MQDVPGPRTVRQWLSAELLVRAWRGVPGGRAKGGGGGQAIGERVEAEGEIRERMGEWANRGRQKTETEKRRMRKARARARLGLFSDYLPLVSLFSGG